MFFFSVATDILRAVVIAFVLNVLVLPALHFAPITVLAAYGLDLLCSMLTAPAVTRLAAVVRETVYRPMVDPEVMSTYLGVSKFRREAALIFVLLLQAGMVAALVYFLS